MSKIDTDYSFGAFTTVFRSQINNYLFHIFNSSIFKSLAGSFLTSTINQLTIGNLNSIHAPTPPHQEQTAIAAFLDRKTAQIDQAVAIKEKQLALLKERKQIQIQNAITPGLNPDAPKRDSGVEWIGEIPAHWKSTRLKFISKIQSGLTLGKSYAQEKLSVFPYLRVANVQNGFFNLDDIASIAIPKNDAHRYLLMKNDILVTEGGDIDKLGRGTVWKSEIDPCLHQNHVFAIRITSQKIHHNYVSQFLATEMARKYFITRES